MGVFTEVVSEVRSFVRERNVQNWAGIERWIEGRPALQDGKYQTYAREGYMTNALVYACIEELSSSASEPAMQAYQAGRWVHQDDLGASAAHRIMALMNNPNPFQEKTEFWRDVITYLSIAGNAYAVKVRSRSGAVRELWPLRPDRIEIVPDAQTFIRRYDYVIGTERIQLPVDDVIHWKRPHPLNDFYGLSPLSAIAGNVDLDNYATSFVKQYFEKAGIPSGILTTKNRMSADLVKEIKERFSREYGGRGNWLGLLVLDGAEAEYTQMTQNLGAQGLVLPELNKINEARIAGAFGVPLSLVGTVLGSEASSYGNKESERRGFWAETLMPLYKDLVGPLNRSLVPEFMGVQRVSFDLSTVKALREDDDKLWARIGKAYNEGLVGRAEGRALLGIAEPEPADDMFLVPSGAIAAPGGVPEEPETVAPVATGVPE